MSIFFTLKKISMYFHKTTVSKQVSLIINTNMKIFNKIALLKMNQSNYNDTQIKTVQGVHVDILIN